MRRTEALRIQPELVKPWMADWNYVPDGRLGSCQCVMGHEPPHREGAIEQCGGPKSPTSNTYCRSCDKLHGEEMTIRKAREELSK